MTATKPPSGRDAHLDSLRGAAALLVLWMHGGVVFASGGAEGLVASLCFELPDYFHFGRVGVVIFFALSGYLIAGSLEGADWRTAFPVKRFFRLFPIYLFSMGIVLLVMDVRWDVLTVLANLTMLPTFLGRQEMMGLYWTLQTEVVFYGVIYLATWIGWGQSRSGLFALSVAFSLVYFGSLLLLDEAALESLPLMIEKLPQHLSIMFWGAFLHKLRGRELWGPEALGLTGFILIPPLVAAVEYLVSGLQGTPPVIIAYITAVLSTYLVIIFKGSDRILAWVGRISYSAYLNHAFVLILYMSSGLPLGVVQGMTLYLGVTLLVSSVTYRLIELPGMRLAKTLVERRQE
jgi:peptidoglycan/LPS O-acetylase OafA/YrhL